MSTALQTPDATGTEHPARAGRLAVIWRDVLDVLEADPSISRASFASWIRGTQLLEVNGDEAVVTAQHSFALDKLDRSFRATIETAVRRRLGNPAVHVRFALARGGALAREGPAARPLPLKAVTKDDGRRADTGAD